MASRRWGSERAPLVARGLGRAALARLPGRVRAAGAEQARPCAGVARAGRRDRLPRGSRAFTVTLAQRVDAFADEAGAAIDHAGVELDEACAGVELGGGVVARQDAAD